MQTPLTSLTFQRGPGSEVRHRTRMSRRRSGYFSRQIARMPDDRSNRTLTHHLQSVHTASGYIRWFCHTFLYSSMCLGLGVKAQICVQHHNSHPLNMYRSGKRCAPKSNCSQFWEIDPPHLQSKAFSRSDFLSLLKDRERRTYPSFLRILRKVYSAKLLNAKPLGHFADLR